MARYKRTAMNVSRSKWAGEALDTFARTTGMTGAGESMDTVMGDLLGDLMHYARQHRIDFDNALRRARGYYADESAGRE